MARFCRIVAAMAALPVAALVIPYLVGVFASLDWGWPFIRDPGIGFLRFWWAAAVAGVTVVSVAAVLDAPPD